MDKERNGLISIIIPVYNVENYLRRCLDSVSQQKNVNLEIILVNDGSTDNSKKICEEYAQKDNRFVVLHQENSGVSCARNHALDKVNGEYIGFVDSDDWIEEDMYFYLLNLIQQHDADVAVCDYIKTSCICKPKKRKEVLTLRKRKELEHFFFRLEGGKSFFSVWNCLFRKDLIKDIRFPEKKINEDICFTYKVYKKANRIIFSNLPKYYYFSNHGSITCNQVCQKDISYFLIWDKIVENEKNTENYQAALFNRKRAVFSLYVKAKLYGISDDMPENTMYVWRKELKKSYRVLIKSKALNLKRKLVLFCICKLNW